MNTALRRSGARAHVALLPVAVHVKALSLLNPWALLVALHEKRVETRGRRTEHRGELALHASQTRNPAVVHALLQEPFRSVLARHGYVRDRARPKERSISGSGLVLARPLPQGIVAVATVVEVLPTANLTPEKMIRTMNAAGYTAWLPAE
jgi:hypothetical protein